MWVDQQSTIFSLTWKFISVLLCHRKDSSSGSPPPSLWRIVPLYLCKYEYADPLHHPLLLMWHHLIGRFCHWERMPGWMVPGWHLRVASSAESRGEWSRTWPLVRTFLYYMYFFRIRALIIYLWLPQNKPNVSLPKETMPSPSAPPQWNLPETSRKLPRGPRKSPGPSQFQPQRASFRSFWEVSYLAGKLLTCLWAASSA